MRQIITIRQTLLLVAAVILSVDAHTYEPAISQQLSPGAALHALFRRATTKCSSGHLPCDYMGYPGFCCASTAQCAVDPVGHIACCPLAAVCTGTVVGGSFGTLAPISSSSHTSSPGLATAIPAVPASSPTSTLSSAIPASFVGSSSSPSPSPTGLFPASRAILNNPYYPFPVIATTYPNAASCSQAWTACQTDYARCTAFLAAQPVYSASLPAIVSVTISAPNYVAPALPTFAEPPLLPSTTLQLPTARSICSSLSAAACSGLQVSACTVFDGGVKTAGAACGGLLHAGKRAALAAAAMAGFAAGL